MAASNILIQTMVDEDKRGQVMNFFGMAIQGAAPFGSLLAGWLAEAVGVRAVVTGSEALVLLGGRCSRPNCPACTTGPEPALSQLSAVRPVDAASVT